MIKYRHYLIKLQNLWSFRLCIVSSYPLFGKLLFMHSIYSKLMFIVCYAKVLLTEAVTRRWTVNMVFLKIFAKLTGKQLCLSFFIKKIFRHTCFFVRITNFLSTPILKDIRVQLHLSLLSLTVKNLINSKPILI